MYHRMMCMLDFSSRPTPRTLAESQGGAQPPSDSQQTGTCTQHSESSAGETDVIANFAPMDAACCHYRSLKTRPLFLNYLFSLRAYPANHHRDNQAGRQRKQNFEPGVTNAHVQHTYPAECQPESGYWQLLQQQNSSKNTVATTRQGSSVR
jgi:hypothetical protein